MNILITGANGFLGQHLTLHLASTLHSITATGRGECRIPKPQSFQYFSCDITNEKEVNSLIKILKPDVLIHTAAMSKPDECNMKREECLRVNTDATKYLLQSFSSLPVKSLFLYVSTDFIFGEDGPHAEDDAPSPLNFYGETKLLAEQLVAQSGLPFCIVRPVFIYGAVWNGLRPSFLHWVKNNLEQHKPIKVVSDQQRTPTYVNDICKGIAVIIDNNKQGVYHLAGKDLLSPHLMAIKVANILHLDSTLIEKVTSETFAEPVRRAKRSGLKIDKAIRELNYRPVSFEDGVRLTFDIHL